MRMRNRSIWLFGHLRQAIDCLTMKEVGMRRIILVLGLIVLLGVYAPAFGGEDDIAKHPECPLCGMDRAKFAHSRMLMEQSNGATMGFCSIRCTAVSEAMFIDMTPQSYGVGDYKTKKLIDAEKAYWVIGGDKMGVMTKRAKWAFEKKSDAEAFVKASGGKVANFEEAFEAAYADMYQDNQMLREKRKMMKEKMKKKQ